MGYIVPANAIKGFHKNMRKKPFFQLLIFFIIIIIPFVNGVVSSTALSTGEQKKQVPYEKLDLIILVRASQHSNNPINGFESNPKTQLQIVQDSIEQIFNSQDYANINIGIMAYGHLKPMDYTVSCSDENVEEVLPLQPFSQRTNLDHFSSISGNGNSPTAIALEEAGKYLSVNASTGNHLKAILLVADGDDDCVRYPEYKTSADVAQNLNQEQGIVVYAIGLNVNNQTSEKIKEITIKANGKYYRTDNNLNASTTKIDELTRKVDDFINDLLLQVSGSSLPIATKLPAIITSPVVSEVEVEIMPTPELLNATDEPLPTSTAIVVDAPSQTSALSGILIVGVLGLIVVVAFGIVYWNYSLKYQVPKTDEKIVANASNLPIDEVGGQNIRKPKRVDVESIDLDAFLQDVYRNYSSFGNSGRYILLDSLKQKFLDTYPNDQFDQLLILARQKYPNKIWIDKNAQGKTIVKIIA